MCKKVIRGFIDYALPALVEGKAKKKRKSQGKAGGEVGSVRKGRGRRSEDTFTTMALGEEGGGTKTSHALGEEGGTKVTTLALGEEGGGDIQATTLAIGEEGGSKA